MRNSLRGSSGELGKIKKNQEKMFTFLIARPSRGPGQIWAGSRLGSGWGSANIQENRCTKEDSNMLQFSLSILTQVGLHFGPHFSFKIEKIMS